MRDYFIFYALHIFTGLYQKFEHNTIYCFFKMFQISMKIGYANNALNITLDAKNNYCTIHRFYKDTKKVLKIIMSFICNIFRSTTKFGYIRE